MACQHEKVSARVSVSNPRDNKDEPDAGYSATISIKCGICGKPFQFLGVSEEPSADRPMVAHDGVELRIPIAPKGEMPQKCPDCDGRGWKPVEIGGSSSSRDCIRCGGTGARAGQGGLLQ